MNTLKVELPDFLPAQTAESKMALQREMEFWVAAKLFESGRVSLGRAAELAGWNKIDFMFELGKHKIPVINYDFEDVKKEACLIPRRS